MIDKPISDLRRRLLQDMTNRSFGARADECRLKRARPTGLAGKQTLRWQSEGG
jgi:hypothetical protein